MQHYTALVSQALTPLTQQEYLTMTSRYGGTLIHAVRDDWGLIEVVDSPGMRSLHFGTAIEQSCLLENSSLPPGFQHEHKMMLAAALHGHPEDALILGLGAGSVARHLYHSLPSLHLVAIERREAVIDVALDYFQLPADERMQLFTADAEHFLSEVEGEWDLIVVDLFDAMGMDEASLRLSFLDRCYEQLRADGLLTMNLWRDDKLAYDTACEYLETTFDEKVWYLDEADGNTIAYAFRGELPALDAPVQARAQHIGIDGHAILRQLQRRNSNRMIGK